MANCARCGTKMLKIDEFCPHCGTPNPKFQRQSVLFDPKKSIEEDLSKYEDDTPKEAENSINTAPAGVSLGFDMEKWGNIVTDIIKMDQQQKSTGQVDPALLQQIMSGTNSMIASVEKNNAIMDKQIKESRNKNKAARASIAKGLCPNCKKRFKKREEYCKHCGASVWKESYLDD